MPGMAEPVDLEKVPVLTDDVEKDGDHLLKHCVKSC